ncbi:DNA mismatch repair protein MutS [Oleidesulfovibrio sp.]|uniref:DNA mismatch repair protein MutS n=1 Tax=Oleidesulfovibrio sp. TaxID=2909707 RepID=UPI003A84A017
MTTQTPKLTPMFEQYLNIKEEYPDALLFYRMGDFYELFFDDAEVAARELQIALTCRNPNAETKVPMCGVPHHAARGYINQLVDKGFKVAICEQVEDPKEAKGLVKRSVIRVLTSGTALDDDNLAPKVHNYLGALYWDSTSGAGGFAWVDFSTGEWSGLQSRKEQELWQWAQKMAPRELLLADGLSAPATLELTDTQITKVPERAYFDARRATEKLLAAQQVAELGALGLESKNELVRACGALLVYLAQTQKQDLNHLGQFKPLNLNKHLLLDEITERNLELFRRLDGRKGKGTLWHVLDHTVTPMGGRLLQERLKHPWREKAPILETQEAVSHFFSNDSLRQQLREALDTVYDIERLSTRIFLNRATPKDYVALRQSLHALPPVRELLAAPLSTAGTYATPDEAQGTTLPAFLHRLLKSWDDLDDYCEFLDNALVDNPPHVITEGGLFRAGFHAGLDELMDLTEHGTAKLNELLAEEQQSTGVTKMKLGNNRVFGYYFEVPRSAATELPDYFVRRQTLANAERYTTEKLKELEDRLFSAADKRKTLELKLFHQVREHIAQARPRVLFMADILATLDHWQGLAEAARHWNWVKPELHDDQDIVIREGRHPVVEAVQGSAGFIPNDLRIDDQRRLLLITGPNMAGKSTVLRQAAIICILAQIGSYVPAREARIGFCDRIFSRVGASDNLAQGQSTFMVEMMETARILRQAGKRSLVILDEIGRGTSTFDGLALAWAVVEELMKKQQGGIRTLFATHYHELTSLEGKIPGVHNMNIAIKEWGGDIVFLRRLVPGPSDRSYGIEVAKLAGVPQNVVQRARRILGTLEQKAKDNSSRHIDVAATSQSLLPGMPEPPDLPAPDTEPEKTSRLEPPVLTALRDLDTNNLTPLEALTVLSEWKLLWGSEQNAD